MSITENIHAVYKLILSDRPIGLKRIAETLKTLYKRVHYINRCKSWSPKGVFFFQKNTLHKSQITISKRFKDRIDKAIAPRNYKIV